MNKLKNLIRNTFASLKAGEQIINKTEEGNSTPITINQSIENKSLANDLLNEVESQEVQNLRYSLYKITDKARDYKILEDGTPIKKERRKITEGRYKFNLPNKKLTQGILETISNLENYDNEMYTVEIQTKYLTRFRIEKYITSIDVDINDKKDIINTELHFSKIPNAYDGTSMPFINELKKALEIPIDNSYALSKNEITDSILNLSFTCLHIEEEDDFTNYSFLNPTLLNRKETSNEIVFLFKWDKYIRQPLNLTKKYYSEEQEKRYQNKEPKKESVILNNYLQVAKCSVCGKVCNTKDGSIQVFDNGQAICKECMEKYNKK